MIIISGNIATGKSTLGVLLSERLGFELVEEDPAENEFLADFYSDMKQWGTLSQISFLTQRTKRIVAALEKRSHSEVIVDRSIEEDFFIFCANLYDYGVIPSREYGLLKDIFEVYKRNIDVPKAYIYLDDTAERIYERVMYRANVYEAKIEIEYVRGLKRRYEYWKATLDEAVFDVDIREVDFRKAEVLDALVERLQKAGLISLGAKA